MMIDCSCSGLPLFFFPSRLSSPTPLPANLHPLPRPYKSLVGRVKNGSTDESMGALFLDLRYVYRRSYMFHNVARHKCRNCRRLSVSSVLVPALLSVACHCVMLTIRALAVSFWLHSSGQAKASGVFFSFAAKWYNLAAIFIAQSRLQGPVIHASRPGPYQAQALCFTDFNLVK